jgi:glycosyltransferase involved in cell wall biosynthesis
MKIAVFHNLPSGGAKRALYNNVCFLAKDHEVDVFVPSIANEDYLSLKDIANSLNTFNVKNTAIGYFVSALKYFPSKVSLTDLEKTQKHIAEVISKADYDVVVCEQDQYTTAPFFLKYIKIPHVYYCQQPSIFRKEISRNLYKNAGFKTRNDLESFRIRFNGPRMINNDKKITSFSKYTVVNSYFSHESILRSYGINSFVSYLGVDTDLFKPIKVPKENFILSVGQCIPEKGFEFILKSLNKIDEKIRPELIIVSNQRNNRWQDYLEKLASQLKVKMRMLFLVSDDELVSLYNKAKLVVYSPYLEPFGLVPLEAMSCGTPVVGVKEGGIRESVIHDYTGILSERDEASFSKGITKLLLDNEKSEKFAKNSIKVVNEFWTLKHSGKRLLNHLNRAIDYYDL